MNPVPYTTDTSADAKAVQLEGLRKMTPRERLQKTITLSTGLRDMAFNAIRRRHPDFNEDQVQLRFVELAYGKELAVEFSRWMSENRH